MLELAQQQQTNRTPRLNTNAGVNAVVNLSPTTVRRSPSPSSSSSSRSSDGSSSVDREGLMHKRRPYRRFGNSSRIGRLSKEKTEEEEESPAFLPWTEGGVIDGANSTPNVEGSSPNIAAPSKQRKEPNSRPIVGGYEPNRRENTSGGTVKRGLQQINVPPYTGFSDSGASTPGSGNSPRRRIPIEGRRGNESSPSMGSSFSDLSGE